jgi:hypothetical protein
MVSFMLLPLVPLVERDAIIQWIGEWMDPKAFWSEKRSSKRSSGFQTSSFLYPSFYM